MSTTTIKIDIDLSEIDSDDMFDHLRSEGYDIIGAMGKDNILDRLKSGDLKEELRLRGDLPQAPSVNLENNDAIIERFVECHHLLTWEQWNAILCVVEKKTEKERRSMPKKYDRL